MQSINMDSKDEKSREEIISEIQNRMKGDIVYGVSDRPPWLSATFLGLQHFLTMFASVLSFPLILSRPLCITDPVDTANLIGTTFFVCGLLTLLQTTLGVRLPIVQGASSGFLVPALAMLKVDGPCPEPTAQNGTMIDPEEARETWHRRMRMIQGAIMVASALQVVMGFTGLMGVLLRFIGPVTIASTIGTIGLNLFPVAARRSSAHWGLAIMTVFLIILFSQVLTNIPIRCPGKRKIYVFQMFSIILSLGTAWLLCWILTMAGALPNNKEEYGYFARTDIRKEVLSNAPWFRFPYPAQWGLPTVTPGAILGMFGGVLASIIDSIGDYYACASLSGAPPPPVHAVNRGIGMEGLGCFFAGLWGSGTGSTSYISNIAELRLTKAASVLVIQLCGVILVLVGMFGKLNAVFATMPDPVVGGMLSVTFGMLTVAGFAYLQFTDLSSSRNLVVVGIAVYFGVAMPAYIDQNPDAINTGSEQFNQFVKIILETGMLVAGIISCLLDNLVPGTLQQRGFVKWQGTFAVAVGEAQDEEEMIDTFPELYECYDLPFGMNQIRAWKWTRYLPFSPTFKGFRLKGIGHKKQDQ